MTMIVHTYQRTQGATKDQLEALIRDALRDMPGITIRGVEMMVTTNHTLKVIVKWNAAAPDQSGATKRTIRGRVDEVCKPFCVKGGPKPEGRK